MYSIIYKRIYKFINMLIEIKIMSMSRQSFYVQVEDNSLIMTKIAAVAGLMVVFSQQINCTVDGILWLNIRLGYMSNFDCCIWHNDTICAKMMSSSLYDAITNRNKMIYLSTLLNETLLWVVKIFQVQKILLGCY